MSPELLAIGVRGSEPVGEGVLCAVDSSEDAVDGCAAALDEAFAPGARDPVADTLLAESIASAKVDTLTACPR